MLRSVNSPGSPIPGISQAILIEGGSLLLTSGHVPLDTAGYVAGTDIAAQLEQVFRNLDATLRAAGTDFGMVARLTIYVRGYDPAHLPAIRQVRDRWIDRDNPPASSLIGVAALFHPDVLVEVDAVAAMPR